jgi:hypothetical protein
MSKVEGEQHYLDARFFDRCDQIFVYPIDERTDFMQDWLTHDLLVTSHRRTSDGCT